MGDQDITFPVDSNASNVDEIIEELKITKISERSGRAMDHEQEDVFEKLRTKGICKMDYSYTPRVVTVGHVDHGKSSFIGRLMYELGQVTEEKFQELKSVSAKRGVEFEFAFLLDALQDERNQGITIDTTQIFLKQTNVIIFLLMPRS